jgi:hypothetical protein
MRLFHLSSFFYRDELDGLAIYAFDDGQLPMTYAKGLLIVTVTGNRVGLF